MVVLAIVGGVRHYTPVPLGDMWDGFIDFYTKSDGAAAWWAQHNEHRITLTKILFWLDLKCFGGTFWFLFAVNYLFVGISGGVFYLILRESRPHKARRQDEGLVALFLGSWLFFWSQKENLTWGFQSQFFLAYLLPLGAFYNLAKSMGSVRATPYFAIALVLGAASVITMANGVLVLPLMTVFGVVSRQSWRRTVVLIMSTVSLLSLYFMDYQSPAAHGSLAHQWATYPWQMGQFVLYELGSPFYYMVGLEGLDKRIALVAGMIFVLAMGFFCSLFLFQSSQPPTLVALIFFLFYIGGTVLGTAAGRVQFGTDQALSSRYTTPILMGWVALSILCWRRFGGDSGWLSPGKLRWGILTLLVLMFPTQRTALKSQEQRIFEGKFAALALQLQIYDRAQIQRIYPNVPKVLSIARKASFHHLSVLGRFPLKDLSLQTVEQLDLSKTFNGCIAGLYSIDWIADDPQMQILKGRIEFPGDHKAPKFIKISDKDGQVFGYGLTQGTEFRAYVVADKLKSPVVLTGENFRCELVVE